MIPGFTYLRLFIAAIVMALFPKALHAQCNVETTIWTTDNFCAPEDSVYIFLAPYGGAEPYSYIWSTGATTPTISVLLVPSDIYFTITDATGCTHVNFIHIKPGPYIAGIGGNYFLCGNSTSTLNLFWYRFPPENVTYLWSTGATTETIDITTGGTYSVTVTDPFNGCTATFSTFVDPPSPELEIVSITPASCGQNNGAINITASGEYSPFTYSWSNGATSEDLNNIGAGTYTVTVTASDGCTATLDATVTGNSNLTIAGTTSPNTSCISNNGSIDITPAPAGSYTYVWSNGSSAQDLSGVASGNYSVTVTASSGCSATANFTVANNQNNPIATTSTIPATCGQNNGSINLNVSGGSQPFEYEWSNGTTMQDLINVGPGTYSVTVTDNNGCTATTSASVSDDNVAINITGNVMPNTSCDSDNGSINISVAPAGSFEFDWSNGAITEDISSLAGGNYLITVTSAEGCTETASFTVVDNLNTPIITSSSTPESCGQNNGAIDIAISNGTAPFNFNWSNGSSEEDLILIGAGTYIVTVTDANGCASTVSAIVSNSNSTLTINGITSPNTLCNGNNGSIDLTLPSGVYSFVWSNNANTEDINELAEGVYSVTVTDGSGCSSNASFTISEQVNPPVPTSVTTPASCTQSTGSIDLNISGGTAPFSFIWSNGSTTEDLVNIDAGDYSLTVTDANGCSSMHNASVLNSNQTVIITGAANPNSSCGNANGSINLSLSGGMYSFVWSNGSDTEDLIGLPAGIYSVTVTDESGCSSDASFTIMDQVALPTATTVTIPASCGQSTGGIELNIAGGSAPFNFNWSNGSTTEDLVNIRAGNYTVTVTDANGCSAIHNTTVSNSNQSLIITGVTSPNSSCNNSNGRIDLTVTPAGAYIYTWSDGTVVEDLNSLRAGNYSVTVTDTEGCSSFATFTVDDQLNSPSLTGTSTSGSCSGNDGKIDISVSGGTTPYLIAWSNGATSEDLIDISSGDYSVIITDANGCTASSSFSVLGDSTDLSITAVIMNNTSCAQLNGAIDITVTPAGSYSFLWSNGSTTEDLVNLPGDEYTVTVTGSGCSATATFIVDNETNGFSLSGVPTPNTSCTTPNGSIDLTITPAGTYSIQWSTGQITEDIYFLDKGTYRVIVTNSNNCSTSALFEVTEDTIGLFVTGLITPASCGLPNGSIELTISPSDSALFSWSNGDTIQNIYDLVAGNYSVTVTDVNNCTAEESFILPGNGSSFTVSGTTMNNESCTSPDGAIELQILPNGSYTYEWSNGSNTQLIDSLSAGSYEVTVSDAFDCSITQSFVIDDLSDAPAVLETIVNETCEVMNGAINLIVTPSINNTFLWSTGDTGESLQNITAGIYAVTVTAPGGCIAIHQYEVFGSETVQIELDADLTGVQVNGTVISNVTLNMPIEAIESIAWTPDENMSCQSQLCLEQTFTLNEPTEIMVVVIDTNGCMDQTSLLIDLEADPKVYIPNVFSPNSGGQNDRFTIYTNDNVEEVVVLEIFNRWGDLLFVNRAFPPNDSSYGWNGGYQGKLMNSDVFAYRAIVRFTDGKERTFRGDVTLVK